MLDLANLAAHQRRKKRSKSAATQEVEIIPIAYIRLQERHALSANKAKMGCGCVGYI